MVKSVQLLLSDVFNVSLLAEFEVCPICRSRDLALNPEGLIVCRSCGTVLGPAVATGALASRRLADYLPLSSTDYHWKDARGVIAPKFKLYEIIARRVGSRLEAEVERLGSLLGLPKVCVETAKVLAARLGGSRDLEYIAAATLFVSCRMAKIYADSAFRNYDVRRLARKAVLVQRKTGVAMPPPPPKQLMFKLAEELGVEDREVVSKALRALDLLTPIIGRGKVAQSAALLLAARSSGYKLEVKDVARAAMVSESALMHALRELEKAFKPSSRRSSRRALS